MNCEECQNDQVIQASLLCRECDQLFCERCDLVIHSRGKRRTHTRLTVCNNCRSVASLECVTCNEKLCKSCKFPHNSHRIIETKDSKVLAVFWDISSITSNHVSITSVLQEISFRLTAPKYVYFYSEGWAEDKIQAKGEVVLRFNVSPVDALLMDLNSFENPVITDVLIISKKITEIKKKLGLIRTGNLKVALSDWTSPLVFEFLNDFNTLAASWPGAQRVELVKKFLLEEAENGRVWVEREEIMDRFFNWGEFFGVFDEGVKKKIFREVVIKMHEKVLVFYSVHFEEVTQNLINWVVKSLVFDELTVSKKTVASRIKKVFGIWVGEEEWKGLKFKFFTERRTKSLSTGKRICFQNVKKNNKGLDSYKNDHFSIRHSDCFEEFLLFVEGYYNNHYRQGVQMSRFGLALIVKYSGPHSLRFLSIGKLIYMTNLCINEGLLRVNSGKIFWTKDFKILDSHLYSKFKDLKQKIIETILKSENLNLSNLRQKLKSMKNTEINLNEFGYSKLRDLMKSIPEIELSNQCLKLKSKVIMNPEKIVDLIEDIVKSKEYAITEAVLQATLQTRLNHSIDWHDYNVKSCAEFIKEYSKAEIQVLKTRECIMLFKTNEQKTYSFFFPFKSYFNSAVLECSKVPTPQIYHPVSHSFDLHLQTSNQGMAPMQRIINISNVPSDIVRSPAREDEDKLESSFRFEDFSSNFDERAVSRSNQHSKNSSFCAWHIRAQSFHAFIDAPESGLNFSWVDNLLV